MSVKNVSDPSVHALRNSDDTSAEMAAVDELGDLYQPNISASRWKESVQNTYKRTAKMFAFRGIVRSRKSSVGQLSDQ